jgi:signal-transduction protein with cAMP-binding, CBS, and nucleotidyltransferase domain
MLSAGLQSADNSLVSFPSDALWSPIEHLAAARLWRPGAAETRRVALSDPAARIVTDFTREPPITVTEDRPIDDALRDMMAAGVRALLVVRGDLVSGLITSYDIQGERPLQFLQMSSYTRHDEIEVGRIMTPWDHIPKLDWSSLRAARVYDLLKVFRRLSATHLVVVERVEHDGAFVRALISRTRLNRQLGTAIE